MKVGDAAEVKRSFSPEEVDHYVALGGAAIVNGEVPEPLLGALFSYLLGVKLPGLGTNYLKQETQYLAPVRVGSPVTARVEITRLRPEKHLADFSTICTDADGRILCRGRALVYTGDVRTAPT